MNIMHLNKYYAFQMLFDFEKNKKFDGIAANALIDIWPLWLPKLRAKREAENPDFGTIWSEEIENVLLLLLFLPCMSPKKVFGSSDGKLIQFHKVSWIFTFKF